MSNNLQKIVILCAILAVAGFFIWQISLSGNQEPASSDTERQEDAELIDGWELRSDKELGITFQYPRNSGTEYLDLIDWPPSFQVISEQFDCVPAGKVSERAGRTENRVVNGREYCVNEIVEGTAGNIYTLYAYMTEVEGRTIVLTTSTRKVQCLNFDEPRQSTCINEQDAFNVDSLIDEVVETLVFRP